MKGDPVPDPDHILRYVGGKHVDQDENGTPVVTGGGFIARPRDDNKPSYNWLECLEKKTIEDQVQQVRNLARVTYGATAKLARLNVGKVRSHIAENTEDNRAVTVIQDPLEAEREMLADPSHALMTNSPNEDDPEGERVGDLIAECVIEIFPARATT
jgi:hypothetical protein